MPSERDPITVPPDGGPFEEQPKWRRDFPIDIPEDEYVARRDLIKFMLLTSGAFVAGHAYLLGRQLLLDGRGGYEPLAIARASELPVGASITFEYPAGDHAPRLLIRTGEDAFVAYDQQCTHLLCPVQPRVAEGTLHCPCHNGFFDLETGEPIAGPPRRPLPRITLDVRDGIIYATGIEYAAP